MCSLKAAGSALSPVFGIFSGASDQRRALKSQAAAQQAALDAATRTQADAAKAEANKRRTPNFSALFDRNTIGSGVSSTALTGAGGVKANTLTLGRNTLLGG